MQAVGRKKTNVHWSGNYHLDKRQWVLSSFPSFFTWGSRHSHKLYGKDSCL